MMRKSDILLTINNESNDGPSSQFRLLLLGYYQYEIFKITGSMSYIIILYQTQFPIDIIHIPDACKAYTNMCFVPARNSLSKEIGSRKLGNKPNDFNLEYTDVSDFTLVRDIQIPPLTKKELENVGTNIPRMAEMTFHFWVLYSKILIGTILALCQTG